MTRQDVGPPRPLWTQPIVAVPIVASLLIVTAAAWLALALVPELRRERDVARDDARRAATPSSTAAIQTGGAGSNEPNIPVAIVQARAGNPPVAVSVPAGAAHFVLWIEAPSGANGTYRLALTPSSGAAAVLTIDGLVPNSDRALAVAVASDLVPAGRYRARLYQSGTDRLVGEYPIAVAHPR